MKRKQRVKRKTAPKVKHVKKISPFIAISLILISLFVISATTYKIVEVVLVNNHSNTFPKLEIFLSEVPIEQINTNDKNLKYPNNTIVLTTNDNSTNYKDVEIKGRGNSTWAQLKRPYQIKFSEKTGLFGNQEAKKWILLADYFDNTHLRNATAFYLERLLETSYPISGEFAEVYIDNNYYGLYYVTEKVEIEKNRVNLTDPYSIIVELDNIHNSNKGCAAYTNNNSCLTIHDTLNADNSDTAIAIFTAKFKQLENAIAKKDYRTIANLIDVDSFAKYFLLNEFINNPDAYSTSFFMYQNGDEDKIHAGPGWDFDLTLGSRGWIEKGIDQDVFLSPSGTMALKNYLTDEVPHSKTVSTIIYDLMDIPEFAVKVKEIYRETLSGKSEELLEYIRSQAEYIKPAALRDQERWKFKTNFDEEVDYLIDWVAKRFSHFEQTYGVSTNQEISSNPAPESPQPSLEL